MASAPKRQDDHDAEREPVPPYPAEVERTWQAFRVTMPAADMNGAEPTPEPATDDDA
jgi:hypothetical protein